MALEDKHLNILQNIEFAISSTYRDNRSMKDVQVVKALEVLIEHYRSLSIKKSRSNRTCRNRNR